MSVKALSWVLDSSEAPGNDRLVLIAIADEADDDGTNAYPSIDRIARRARVNKRTTMRAIERLEEAAELFVIRPETSGRGHFNRYVVMMGRSPEAVAALLAKGDTLAPTKGRASARIGAPMSAPDPLTPRPDGDPQEGITDPEVQRLCDLLADLIEANGSKRPTVTDRWRQECDRLMRLDGKTPVQVERCIRWCQGDTFWRANVLSMPKLREKYDRLRLAAERDRGGPIGPRAPISQDRDRPTERLHL